jgi:hypothetical protein
MEEGMAIWVVTLVARRDPTTIVGPLSMKHLRRHHHRHRFMAIAANKTRNHFITLHQQQHHAHRFIAITVNKTRIHFMAPHQQHHHAHQFIVIIASKTRTNFMALRRQIRPRLPSTKDAPSPVTPHNLATGKEGMPTMARLQVVKDVQMVAPLPVTLHSLVTDEEGTPITALPRPLADHRHTTAPEVLVLVLVRVRSGPLARPLEIREGIAIILRLCPLGWRTCISKVTTRKIRTKIQTARLTRWSIRISHVREGGCDHQSLAANLLALAKGCYVGSWFLACFFGFFWVDSLTLCKLVLVHIIADTSIFKPATYAYMYFTYFILK